MKNPSSKYLKIGQAAKALGVSIDTLRRWEKAGKITAIRTPGGTRLYSLSTLKKVNPALVETYQTSSLSTEELLKIASKPKTPVWESAEFESEESEETQSDNIKKTFITKFLVGSAILLTITLLLTSWITASYLTNPKDAKQFFKNNVASGILSPFHLLAQGTVAVIDPKKAKELGFSEPEPPPPIPYALNPNISSRVLAVTSTTPFLEVNSDTQINGSLFVRDSINGLSLEATPSAGTINLTAGNTTLTVTKTAKLDQDVSTASSPTFNTLKLSAIKEQLIFQSGGPTGTLTWTPTAARTLTLPDATTTLVGTGNTQTLTGKSMSGSDNTFTNIPNSALTNSKVTVTAGTNLSGGGDVTLGSSITIALKDSPAVTSITTSGIVSLADGTAAAPALTFTNDLDTGLYRIGSNKIGLITGGTATSGITIDSSGNLGVGTISPGATLSVSGNVGIGFTGTSASAPGLGLAVAGSVGIGTTSPAYKLDVVGQVNGSAGLCIASDCKTAWSGSGNYTASNGITLSVIDFQLGGSLTRATAIDIAGQNFGFLGNVGIGNSTPDYALKVTGTGYFSSFVGIGSSLSVSGNTGIGGSASVTGLTYALGGLRVNGFSDLTGNVGVGGTAIFNSLAVFNGGISGNLSLPSGSFLASDGSAAAPSHSFVNDTDSGLWRLGANQLVLSTNGGGLNGLMVNANGNVGIGTTNPGQALEVVGDGRLGLGTPASDGYQRSLWFSVDAVPANVAAIRINRVTEGNSDYALEFQTKLDPSAISTKMIIKGSGNVGIGTTTPNSLLSVVGGAHIGSIRQGITAPTDGLFVDGNVGIGATSTAYNLDVWGTGRISSALTVGGNIGVGASVNAASAGIFGSLGTSTLSVSGASNLSTLNVSGNTGIGGTASVTGLTYALGGLRVNGFSDLTGNVGVGGTAIFNNPAIFNNGITSNGTFTSTGQFLAGNGSASAPSYSFTNLTNAGLWTNGNGLLLTTGGSNTSGITVTGAGNVGIGTTAPASTFEVASSKTINFNSSPVSNLTLGTNMAAGGYNITNAGSLISSTVYSVYNSGDTSIGMALDNAATSGKQIIFQTRNTANSTYLPRLAIGTLADTTDIDITNATLDLNNNLIANIGNTNTDFTSTGGLNLAGNLGIGTTVPQAKLAIQGNVGIGYTGVNQAIPVNGLAVFGNVGVGITTANSTLSVAGGAHIGSLRQGISAPTDGLFVDGNVGIGATSTAYNLDVWGTARISSALTVGGNIGVGASVNAASAGIFGSLGTSTLSVSGASNLSTLTTSGNVGIGGTATISSALCLGGECKSSWSGSGNYTASNGLTLSGVDFQLGGALTRATGIDIAGQNFGFLGGNVGIGTTGNLYGGLTVKGAGTGTNITLQTYGSGLGQGLTVLDNGNVGIGTTGPEQKLHVFAGSAGTITANPNAVVVIERDNSAYINFLTPNTAASGIMFGDPQNDYIGGIEYLHSTDTMNLRIAGSTKLVVDSSGNVGIGTTSPLSLLSISGGAHIGSIRQGISAPTDGLFVDGNVGIGATTSSNKLDVWGNSRIAGTLAVDSTLTALNGLIGFSGVTAPTSGLAISGNLGVGTTSPLGNLHVVGQCVTGDTKLRRRKRRKDGTWSDEYENVDIKDIKEGDQILSLNEKTGGFEPHTVKALKEMGRQETIKIVTQSGKWIETTNEHPYLTIEKDIRRFDQTEIFEVDLSPRFEEMGTDTIVAVANKKYQATIRIIQKEKMVFKKLFKKEPKLFAPILYALSIVEIIKRNQLHPTQLRIDTDYTGHQRTMERIIHHFYPEIIISFVQVGHGSFADKAALEVFRGKKIATGVGLNLKGFPTAEWLHHEWLHGSATHTIAFFKDYHKFTDLSMGSAVWKKVKYLKPGDIIATSEGWEKISAKYSTGRKQVFDIEVEGTHNFVGNDIVAHNTFITGNVGIGATSTAYNLDVWGTARISSALTVGGNIGVGASVNAASAGIFGSLGTSTLSVSGASTLSTLTTSGNTGIGGTASITGLTYALGGLRVNGFSDLTGNLGVGGTAIFNSLIQALGGLTLSGNILPSSNDTFDLGSDSLRWNNLYLGPATVHLGTSTSDEYTIAYDTTNNRLGFNVNGSGPAEIVMDSSGNVGIGTTNPAAALDVVGGINITQNITSSTASRGLINTGGNILLRAPVGSGVLVDDGTSPIASIALANNYFAGNVGIGMITTPATRLQVLGSGTGTGVNLLTQNSTKTNFGLAALDNGNVGIGYTNPGSSWASEKLGVMNTSAGAGTVGLNLINNSSNTNTAISLDFTPNLNTSLARINALRTDTGGGGTTDFVFSNYKGSTAALTETMRIKGDSGNVGVGTTSPGASLSVSGNGVLGFGAATSIAGPANGLGVSGNVGIGTTTANSNLSVVGNAHIGSLYQGTVAPSNGLFVDGNVGIGATTSSNKLDVWGNARVAGTGIFDSTLTALNGLIGFSGVTAPTSGLAISGNLGVGTTSPLGQLHVVGQCVAEGTRIRRRRKNKKGEWEEEDIPVEDIKLDDEVLSLNDQTGKWEWHTVEATLDKGIQTVYRLETETGKWIETTSEHPYLVKVENSHQKTASYETVSSGLTRFANNNEPDLRIAINLPQEDTNVKSQKGVDPTGIEPVRPEFLDPTPEPGGPTQGLLSQNANSFSTKWTKVFQIKPGMEIATAEGWEKVESIKKVGRKQTYDLQIEGTHNFVGNDIVAHNTFINGNVGIGATSTAYNLDVWGTGRFSSALTVGGNIGVGASVNAASAGIFGSLGTSTLSVSGASNLSTLTTSGNAGIGGSASVTGLTYALGGLRVNGFSDLTGNVGIGGTASFSSLVTSQGSFLGPNGAKTTPTFSFLGDTDNGMYLPSANALSFSTAGNDVLTLTAGGNVGVGLTNPAGLFDVNGKLVVLSGGNVGIGTANPTAQFEINSSTPYLRLRQDTTAEANFAFNTTNGLVIDNSSNSYPTRINGSAVYLMPSGNIGLGTTSPLSKLSVAGGAHIGSVRQGISAPTDGLFVDGNVGIGATSTAYNLDVWGTARISSALTVGGNIGVGASVNAASAGIFGSLGTSTLSVSGASNLSTLTVSGNTGIGGSASVTGLTYALGGLRVNGFSDLTGNVGIGSSLNVSSVIVGNNGLVITGTGAFSSRISGADAQNSNEFVTLSQLQGGTGSLWQDGGDYLNPNSSFATNIRIPAGNLGIGTSATSGSTLQINGNGVIGFGTAAVAGPTNGLAVFGNVGVGTTSPAGALHVVGQCVIGETKLKRRKRRKGKNGEWEDYWEDVRIDQIEAGDEILTLDEKTGRFIASKVKALKEMGKKDIVRMTTEQGKTISTTSEHPYLAKLAPVKAGLDFAFVDEVGVSYSPDQPLFGVGALIINDTLAINKELHDILTGALSYYKKNSKRPGRFEFKFNLIKKRNVRFFKKILDVLAKYDWNFWYVLEDKPSLSLRDKSFIHKDLPANYIWERYNAQLKRIAVNFTRPTVIAADYFDEPNAAVANLSDVLQIANVQNIMQSESHGSLLLQVVDIFVGAVNFRAKFELSPDLPRHKEKKEISDLVVKMLEDKKMRGYKLSSCLSRMNIITGDGPCQDPEQRRTGQEESNLMTQIKSKWIKIKELKPGMEIATLGPDGQIEWQAIKTIEKVGREQVFDIEVEGTHNFVGNDIVAHNTFITGNVGIGATSTAYNLDVWGTGRFSSALTVGGNIGIGASVNAASAGIFGSLGTSTLSVSGASNLSTLTTSGNTGIGGSASVTGLTYALGGLRVNGFSDLTGNVGVGGTAIFNSLAVFNGGISGNLSLPSGSFLASDGSAAAPSHSFVNDTDSGLWRLGANQLVLSTNGGGLNGLMVDGNGNVGIGTTGPGAKLHVFGGGIRVEPGTSAGYTIYDGATERMHLYYQSALDRVELNTGGSATAGIILTSNGNQAFSIGGTARMTINTSGNVGIGTTVPQAKLVIQGNVGIGYTGVNQSIPVNGLAVFGNVGIGTTTANSMLSVAGGAHIGSIRQGISAPTDGLFVDGNVGIGATSTAYNLDVWGTGRFSSALTVGGNIGVGASVNAASAGIFGSLGTSTLSVSGASNLSTLNVSGNTGIGGSASITGLTYALGGLRVNGFSDLTGNVGVGGTAIFNSLVYSQGSFLAPNGSASAPSYSFTNLTNAGLWTNGDGLLLTTGGSNTSGLTVTGAGNIGIGTTAPVQKLEVNGASQFDGNIILSGDATRITKTYSAATTAQPAIYVLQANAGGGTGYGNALFRIDNRSSNDFLSFDNNGTNVLTVTSAGNLSAAGTLTVSGTGNSSFTGNVGIGTTVPQAKLSIQGNVGIGYTGVNQAIPVNGLAVSGNVGIGITTANSNLSVSGNAHIGSLRQGIAAPADGLFVDGNVGIGATSTAYNLDVWGTGRFSSALTVGGNIGIGASVNAASAGIFGSLGTSTLSVSGASNLSTLNVSGNTGIGGSASITGLTYALGGLRVNGFSDLTGNVGVGGTAVFNSLIQALGGLTLSGNILPSSNDTFDLGSDSLRWNNLYLGPATVHLGTSTSDEYTIAYDTTNNRLGFNVNGSGPAEIVMDSSGNVGIGTTSPTETLTVAGSGSVYLLNTGGLAMVGTPIRMWSGTIMRIEGTTTPSNYVFQGSDGSAYEEVARVSSPGGGAGTATFDLKQGKLTGTLQGNSQNITGLGNVGIGTTGPGASLSVSGNSTIGFGGAASIAGPSNGLGISGNLGIGTTSPNNKLQVVGAGVFGADYGQYSAPANGLLVQGNVGVGSTGAVGYGLDVWGTGRFSSALTVGGNIGVGASVNAASAGIFGSLGTSTLSVSGASNLSTLNVSGNTGIGGSASITGLTYALGGLRVNGFSDLTGNVGIGGTATISSLLNASGILNSNGSASTPSYSFTNLTNAGLWTNGNGLLLTTGGSNTSGITVTGAGNIGIGTTSPANKLEIKSTSGSNILQLTNSNLGDGTNNALIISDGTNEHGRLETVATQTSQQGADGVGLHLKSTVSDRDLGFSTATNRNMRWYVGTSPKMILNSNGNVGIGTTSPNSLLSVAGGAHIGSVRQGISAPTDGLFVDGNVGIGATTSSNKLDVWGNSRIAGTLTLDSTITSLGGLLGYAPGTVLSSGTNLAVSGNVGIGTTTPLAPLHVWGNGTNSALFLNGNVGIGTTTPQYALDIAGNSALWQSVYGTDDGLVGYWPFSEGTGTKAYDLSPSGNDGTLTSGPTWTTGKYGNALSFDGTDDYVLSANSETDLTTFTAEAWIKPDNVTPAGTQTLISHGSSPTDNGWTFEIPASQNKLRLTFNGVGNYDSNSGILTASVWQHAVVTLTGTTATFYVNGAKVGTATTGSMGVATHKYAIGATPGGTNFFSGSVDEVRVYNRVLSADEVKAHYLRGNVPGKAIAMGTSTAAGNLYGLRGVVANTGIVTTGTDTTYGSRIDVTRTGATGGTINTYGQYIALTADNAGAGTSKSYGLYVDTSGSTADNNYSAAFIGGNVGIGTTAPTYKLQLDDQTISSTDLGMHVTNGSGGFYLVTNNNDFRVDAGRNGTDLTVLGTNGNVGIGTTSPGAALDVRNLISVGTYGNGGTEGRITFQTANASETSPYIIASSGNLETYSPTGWFNISAANGVRIMGDATNLWWTANSGNATFDFYGASATTLSIKNTNQGTANLSIPNGNVGIGTSAAGAALQVNGGGLFGWGTASVAGPVNGLAVFGNVGIGTTSPAEKLDVVGNIKVSGLIQNTGTNILDQGGGGFAGAQSIRWSGNESGYLLAVNNASTAGDADGALIKIAGTGTQKILTLNSNGTDRFTVLGNGNVGIGMTGPVGLLQVGTSPSPGLLVTSAGKVVIGATDPGDKMLKIVSPAGTIGLQVQAASGNNAMMSLDRPTTGNWGVYKILTADSGTDGWSFGAVTGTNRFGFLADDDSTKERLTILNNGNVGIGTASPGSALTVIGNVGIGTSAAGAALQVNGGGLFGWGTASTALSSGSIAAFNGNVGVGTTIPNAQLDVYKAGSSVGTWVGRIVSRGDIAAVTIGESNSVATIGGHNSTLGAWANLAINPGGGNVGIGTTSPTNPLTVISGIAAGSYLTQIRNTTLSGEFMQFVNSAGSPSVEINQGSTGEGILIVYGSAVTCTIGNGTSATNCSVSDTRLKDNITPLSNISGLDAIKLLNPVSFNWNSWMQSTGASSSAQFGFVAQDVQNVFPNLVHQDANTGYYTLDYQGLVAPMVKAIQEQQVQIASQSAQLVSQGQTLSKITGALTIADTGNVGIGTTAPTAKLQITGDSGQLLNIGSSTASILTITSSGNVGIGTTSPSAPLEVRGSGTGATIAKFTDGNSTGCTLATGGTISCSSDINLKKNITDIDYGLDALMNLHPVAYNWKSEADGTIQSLGFIAQEVEQVIPKLVITDPNSGLKELNTIGLIPVLTKSIQELNNKISAISIDNEGNLVIPKLKAGTIALDPSIANTAEATFDVKSRIDSLEERIAALESTSGESKTTPEVSTSSAQIATSSAELKLTPPDILLATGSAQLASLTVHSEATVSGKLTAYDLDVQNGLKALGKTTLSDTTVAGTLTVDGILAIENGSEINVMGTLYLQKSYLADGLDILNGKVTIDKNGHLTAQKVSAPEVVTNKLTISNAPIASSSATLAASIGSAVIPAGSTEIPVFTSAATAGSKIFLTATSQTGGQSLVVSTTVDKTGFVVSLDHATNKDIKFNWWIIETQ